MPRHPRPRGPRPRGPRPRAKKRLGQNFLIDPGILRQIADYLEIQPGDTVIEIGAGTGALTTHLAEQAEWVLAVEVDASLAGPFQQNCARHSNIERIEADVLQLDWTNLIGDIPREKLRVVGNLPYYITTPILMKLLGLRASIHTVLLMVQHEVAQRLIAPPGTRVYGAPSVAVAYHADATLLRRVPPSVFRPRPKVESAILCLRMRERPAVDVDDGELFFRVVRGAFQHRRKTLRNSLIHSGIIGDNTDRLDAAIAEANLDPTIRPEKLGLAEFAALTQALWIPPHNPRKAGSTVL